MNYRFSVVAMLTVGALLTMPGGALAASATSSRLDAVAAQYGVGVPPQNSTLNDTQAGVPTPTVTPTADPAQGGVAGATRPGSAPPRSTTAVAGSKVQTSAGSGLPFTGYAALPVLLIGLALLVGGVMLRGVARRRPIT